AMPGTGIENFDALAKEIAKAGIYDFRIHHEQILVPVILRHWKVADVTGLSTEGEKAREALIKRIDKIGRVAGRLSREQSCEPRARCQSSCLTGRPPEQPSRGRGKRGSAGSHRCPHATSRLDLLDLRSTCRCCDGRYGSQALASRGTRAPRTSRRVLAPVPHEPDACEPAQVPRGRVHGSP
ncbi:MAG: hypothetical protein EBX87_04395, partial [Actinobacteria bacterium]|nr:hypothetical protein [Actinomycetota bacterium]